MIPNFQEFFLPLLEHTSDGKEYTLKEMVEYLSNHFNLTSEERQEMIPSQKQPTVYNRIVWSNTYLKKAGLISSPKRGVILITEKGKSVLAKKPKEITTAFLKQFPEFLEFHMIKKNGNDNTSEQSSKNIDLDQDPQTTIVNAYQTINNSLSGDLLDLIMQKDAYFFERLVVELLVKMGYSNEPSSLFVTKKSGDEGIDGIIRKDKLGFDLIGVQAKRWDIDSSVGRPAVQSFAGALGGKSIANGVFFTTAKFSEPAKQYNHPGIKIILIDGIELTKLMITHNIGVQKEEIFEIKKIDTDFFDEF